MCIHRRHARYAADGEGAGPQAHDGPHSRHEGASAGGARPSRLYRNTERGVIFGVCAGLADYFGISRFIVRIVAVIALFMFPPPTLFCYFMAALLIPRAPAYHRSEERRVGKECVR